MTTLNEARQACYERFLAQWTGTPARDVTFENEAFDAPTGRPYVLVEVRQQAGGQETLGKKGNRRYRRVAIVRCTITAPTNTGMAELDALAQEARGIYEGESFDGLDFDNGQVFEQPAEDADKRMVAQTEFKYEERK